MPDTLHYRFGAPDDVEEVARLVAHSFPGATRSPIWWQEQLRDPIYGGGAGTLFVGRNATGAVAACQLHPLRQWVGGEAVATAGVGTVAISPTHRQRGLGAELVTVALRAARERGDLASSLYPFRVSFYRKLGYGQAGEVLQYQVPPDALPDSEERRRVERLESDDGQREALELYNRWAREQNGQLVRSERLWAYVTMATDRALVGYRPGSGRLEGYALVTYRPDLPVPTRYLEVDELVWTTPAARAALHGWLSSLGDQWRQILVRALPSHRLGDRLREPRLPFGAAPAWRLWAPTATLLQGTMFRLLDAPAAWERRRVAPGAPLAVGLEVSDAQLEENSGTWRLVLEDGRAHVEPGTSSELTLRLDASMLSRLYIGSISPSDALHAELLECDRPDRLPALDAALALPEPWTFDRF